MCIGTVVNYCRQLTTACLGQSNIFVYVVDLTFLHSPIHNSNKTNDASVTIVPRVKYQAF